VAVVGSTVPSGLTEASVVVSPAVASSSTTGAATTSTGFGVKTTLTMIS
jgi:hypothetical protein